MSRAFISFLVLSLLLAVISEACRGIAVILGPWVNLLDIAYKILFCCMSYTYWLHLSFCHLVIAVTEEKAYSDKCTDSKHDFQCDFSLLFNCQDHAVYIWVSQRNTCVIRFGRGCRLLLPIRGSRLVSGGCWLFLVLSHLWVVCGPVSIICFLNRRWFLIIQIALRWDVNFTCMWNLDWWNYWTFQVKDLLVIRVTTHILCSCLSSYFSIMQIEMEFHVREHPDLGWGIRPYLFDSLLIL